MTNNEAIRGISGWMVIIGIIGLCAVQWGWRGFFGSLLAFGVLAFAVHGEDA